LCGVNGKGKSDPTVPQKWLGPIDRDRALILCTS